MAGQFSAALGGLIVFCAACRLGTAVAVVLWSMERMRALKRP
jgi:hypothetical protein